MKIQPTSLIITLGISVLIAYGLYVFSENENKVLIGVGSAIISLTTLVAALGVSYNDGRVGANIRIVGMLFFSLGITSNIVFSTLHFPRPAYIVTNGILLLLFLLIANFIRKTKE